MTTHDPSKAPPELSARHRRTYDAIFRHPEAHNLDWHGVRSLLDALAQSVEMHNGSLQVTRNGKTTTMHAPGHGDVASIEHLLEIRRFLQESGDAAASL